MVPFIQLLYYRMGFSDIVHKGDVYTCTWTRMRSLIYKYEWVEFYADQKDQWLEQMDHGNNLRQG